MMENTIMIDGVLFLPNLKIYEILTLIFCKLILENVSLQHTKMTSYKAKLNHK